MGKTISFERLKKIAIGNVSRTALGIGIGDPWDGTAKIELMNMKSYLSGGDPMRFWPAVRCIEDELKKAISMMDIRCLGELLDLIPKGQVNGVPNWVYDGVNAYMDEDGWMLAPKLPA